LNNLPTPFVELPPVVREQKKIIHIADVAFAA
jgi:hypothetical protein